MRARALIILLLILVLDLVLGAWLYFQWRNHHYDREIAAASERYGVDPKLIRAVIWTESRFNAEARGKAGEIGLMQLMDLAAQDWAAAESISPWNHEMCADPGTNTLVGTWYLAKLIRRYPEADNPLVYALADYNAGRTHVLRWAKGPAATNSEAFLEAMTFPTTREYIRTVLRRYEDD